MASITDVPYNDIVKFIKANNKEVPKITIEAYNLAFELLKNRESIGHTKSIVEWMLAYNLIIKKVNIRYYTSEEIDNMDKYDINELIRLLRLEKSVNINTIKNILRYLVKLEEIQLLPEIKQLILLKFGDLEIEDLNIYHLNPDDIIYLLRNSRNKAMIRKFLYENAEKIIYNFFITRADIIDGDDYQNLYKFCENKIAQKMAKIFLEKFHLLYTTKEEDELTEKFEQNMYGDDTHELYFEDIMAPFLFELIKLREIEITKKFHQISLDLHFLPLIMI